MFLPQWFWKCDTKAPKPLYGLKYLMSFACHSHAICMSLVCIRMSFAGHSYVIVCHPYVTRMYSYVICMPLVCTRMLSVCHSYVLVCHSYVTRMYSYVIRMSLICTRLSSVCHSYALVSHRMTLVCGFSMNPKRRMFL